MSNRPTKSTRKDKLGARWNGVIASALATNSGITGHPQGRVATGNGALFGAAPGSRGTLTSGFLLKYQVFQFKFPILSIGRDLVRLGVESTSAFSTQEIKMTLNKILSGLPIFCSVFEQGMKNTTAALAKPA